MLSKRGTSRRAVDVRIRMKASINKLSLLVSSLTSIQTAFVYLHLFICIRKFVTNAIHNNNLVFGGIALYSPTLSLSFVNINIIIVDSLFHVDHVCNAKLMMKICGHGFFNVSHVATLISIRVTLVWSIVTW